MLKWPDAHVVHGAVRSWAAEVARTHPEVERVGYVGSYARGNWGVGSDVDLVMIVAQAARPFMDRASAFDVSRLPVPADLVVYTAAEWKKLVDEDSRFAQAAEREGKWVLGEGPGIRQEARA